MIERVARAFKECELDCSMWDDEPLQELARVAIEAMREPDNEMIRAIFCFPLGDRRFQGAPSKETEVVNSDTSIAIWKAMIDAALKEELKS